MAVNQLWRRAWCAAALVVLTGFPVSIRAQEEEGEAAVFRTGTELVQVDVIVRRGGEPVTGLTADDFEIYDNGVRQQIGVFSVRQETRRTEPITVDEGVVTNWPAGEGQEPVSGTVILIDRLNTEFRDQASVRLQVLEFLDSLSAFEPIAVYSLNEILKVVQPFTTDRESIRLAVDQAMVEASFGINPYEQEEQFRDRFGQVSIRMMRSVQAQNTQTTRERRAMGTADAFATIAENMSGLPGRKKLLWISAAPASVFTFESARNESTLLAAGQGESGGVIERQNMTRPLDESARLLNEANIALYPIDPRGPDADLKDEGITTMIRLAGMTGGRAMYGSNGMAEEIREALYDTDLTYTLGYYVAPQENEGRSDEDIYHALEVKVNQPGVEVRHRMGYAMEEPPVFEDNDDREDRFKRVMQDELNSNDLVLTAWMREVPGDPDKRKVEVGIDASQLRIDYDGERWKGSFDFAVIPDVKDGKGHQETFNMNLTEQTYLGLMSQKALLAAEIDITGDDDERAQRAHVVVMDGRTGKAGSLWLPIQ